MNSSERASIITAYLDEVKHKYYSGIAVEHAYRPALQRLIEALCPNVNAINDAKRVEVGAPDFVLTRSQNNPQQGELFTSVPLGFLEAKDLKPGILDKPENQEQLKRYMELGNVVHTDSLNFRFYFNKELVKEVRVGYLNEAGHIVVDSAQWDDLAFHFERLVERHGRTIRTAKALAIHMADRARQIRHTIFTALSQDVDHGRSTELSQQYDAFKKTLIHDLTPEGFADIYAETIAYGLFAARYNDDTPDGFSIAEAAQKLPKTNPFLHKFFLQIAAYEREDRLNWVLDNFAELFNHTDVHAIMSSHGVRTGMSHDPVIHFYETFLGEYDAKRRKARGVYYTPLPVVQYIVRAVDDVLKKEFGLAQGLADDSTVDYTYQTQPFRRKFDKKDRTENTKQVPRVQVLDPATGTGTFLNEIIKHIYEVKGKSLGASWSDYVEKNLMPRLHGFELLMAAYAMAHMRLGLTLTETGYRPSAHPPRLSVYLTNTLEPPAKETEDNTLLGLLGMARTLSEESHDADRIKRDQPIMVVIGNPPYSISSSNKNKFIEDLTADYKKDLNERNIQPLSDDYIKFIRYAENMVEKNGQGIVAMITNNSYFDGLIHRQMRKHLLQTFDKVYVLDLHGNSKKKEVAPDGGKDENVFDIMQGVGIIIAVKNLHASDNSEVNFKEYYGSRETKYNLLTNARVEDNNKKLQNKKPGYYLVDKNFVHHEEYSAFVAIQDLMPLNSTGVTTHRDGFVIDAHKAKLIDKIKKFYVVSDYENYLRSLDVKISGWEPAKAKLLEYDDSSIACISYKPFDTRFIYYNDNFVTRSRRKTMRHMIHENLGIVTCKNQTYTTVGLISNEIVDTRYYSAPGSIGRDYVFPLYRYENDGIIANLADAPLKKLLKNLEPYCYVDREEDVPGPQPDVVITALDVLDYVYGVLYSPRYREKYKEFLKIDFPRIPAPENHEEFSRLVGLGGKLRQLHLMDETVVGDTPYPFHGEGDNIVTKPQYQASKTYYDQGTSNRFVGSIDEEHSEVMPYGNVHINDSQCFVGVPEIAWNFYIGGYQPAQKWLKDRKGKPLGYKDIEHYQKIIKVLCETHEIMEKIDV